MSAHLKLVSDELPPMPATVPEDLQWLYTAVDYLLTANERLTKKVADLEGRVP